MSRVCLIDKEIRQKRERIKQMKEESEGTVEKARKTIRLIADKLKDKQRRLDEWRAL